MIDASEQWAIVGRLALAAALGAIIGLEREYRGYPAGVRTMALVCMGATIFAAMSLQFGEIGGAGTDSSRIAAQIVSGIGFLGAGLIFREGFTVRGVTTAATIWCAAAIGIAVSAEGYIIAVFGTLFAVILLELRIVTKHIRPNTDTEDDGHLDADDDNRSERA